MLRTSSNSTCSLKQHPVAASSHLCTCHLTIVTVMSRLSPYTPVNSSRGECNTKQMVRLPALSLLKVFKVLKLPTNGLCPSWTVYKQQMASISSSNSLMAVYRHLFYEFAREATSARRPDVWDYADPLGVFLDTDLYVRKQQDFVRPDVLANDLIKPNTHTHRQESKSSAAAWTLSPGHTHTHTHTETHMDPTTRDQNHLVQCLKCIFLMCAWSLVPNIMPI